MASKTPNQGYYDTSIDAKLRGGEMANEGANIPTWENQTWDSTRRMNVDCFILDDDYTHPRSRPARIPAISGRSGKTTNESTSSTLTNENKLSSMLTNRRNNRVRLGLARSMQETRRSSVGRKRSLWSRKRHIHDDDEIESFGAKSACFHINH